jgi:DNA-binding MarR family transcriptional regulator
MVGAMVQVVNDPVGLANDLRPLLLRIARHLRAETHTRGITGAQVSLLVALEFNPGMTAQQLAEREGLSAPGVSGHLARLEGQKLIRRERGSDRRRVGLFLTNEGGRVLATVRDQRTSWLAARIGELSEADRAKLRAALGPLDHVSMGDR